MAEVYVACYSVTCWDQPDRDVELKCIGVYSEKNKAIEEIIKDSKLFNENEYFKKIIREFYESEIEEINIPERIYYGSKEFKKCFEDNTGCNLPDILEESDHSIDDSINDAYGEDDIRRFYRHKDYIYNITIYKRTIDV